MDYDTLTCLVNIAGYEDDNNTEIKEKQAENRIEPNYNGRLNTIATFQTDKSSPDRGDWQIHCVVNYSNETAVKLLPFRYARAKMYRNGDLIEETYTDENGECDFYIEPTQDDYYFRFYLNTHPDSGHNAVYITNKRGSKWYAYTDEVNITGNGTLNVLINDSNRGLCFVYDQIIESYEWYEEKTDWSDSLRKVKVMWQAPWSWALGGLSYFTPLCFLPYGVHIGLEYENYELWNKSYVYYHEYGHFMMYGMYNYNLFNYPSNLIQMLISDKNIDEIRHSLRKLARENASLEKVITILTCVILNVNNISCLIYLIEWL